MKQQCPVAFVYGSWLILAAGFMYNFIRGDYVQAVFFVCFVALFLWLYVRFFPAASRFLGYGSVEDIPAKEVKYTDTDVLFYTGIGCPFCPIVKKRLEELKLKMGFRLTEIDVTLKPGLLISKGIRALPVVEVGGSQLIGNATSEHLAAFIADHIIQSQTT
jgi:glutaredoxin